MNKRKWLGRSLVLGLSVALMLTIYLLIGEKELLKNKENELLKEKIFSEEIKEEKELLKKESEIYKASLVEKNNEIKELEEKIEFLEATPTPKPTSPLQSSDGLRSIGIYELTAYCSCERCCGQWSGGPTASGVMPSANHTVASNSLPFGTKLNIKGAIYTVEDTGGMADDVIDIYFSSHQEALNFGRQTAEVFVVE